MVRLPIKNIKALLIEIGSGEPNLKGLVHLVIDRRQWRAPDRSGIWFGALISRVIRRVHETL